MIREFEQALKYNMGEVCLLLLLANMPFFQYGCPGMLT